VPNWCYITRYYVDIALGFGDRVSPRGSVAEERDGRKAEQMTVIAQTK
jgi:hypothetical protein